MMTFNPILLPSHSGPVAISDLTAMDAKYDYEYLIKFKNMSYSHVQWLSASDIGKRNDNNHKNCFDVSNFFL
jgi:hypothetical protein